MPQISVTDNPSKDDPVKIDLAIVARDLKLPPDKIEKTVELLDAGNTIPFITRFRKDLTGGLNEQQLLSVKQRVAQLRALAERKAFVLKSIESQGKLNDELKAQINKTSTNRRLEDLYLPYKPKKQSRASLARQQGLEPLAEDIFSNVSGDIDLATRATDFVRVDKGLTSVDDVIKGVGDLLAERFSENNELRSTLRKIMWTEGKLASQAVVTAPKESAGVEAATKSNTSEAEETSDKVESERLEKAADEKNESAPSGSSPSVEADPNAEAVTSDQPSPEKSADAAGTSESAEAKPSGAVGSEPSTAEPVADTTGSTESTESTEVPSPETPETETPATEAPQSESAATDTGGAQPVAVESTESGAAKPKKKKKKKKKKPADDPYKDYRDFKQAVKQVPNHRILAINRGERAGALKVKIDVDDAKLSQTATSALVPENHPCTEFLQKCVNDALSRLVVPSLEREIRRELTESAEKHAVDVFANNLRNLLLQRPIRNTTVLAIDPGFKRGCSVAVLDRCGELLESGHVFVVGNPTRREESRQKIADWVKKHNVDVIAIGNGAACRQTEQMVSDVIGEKLQDVQTRYTIVNEAGASIYSTSEIGREELPDVTPSIRSAASIGRRLQDPLSELVKISPANIGVGMYQHDVKAKHLSSSLDDVVQFCVNRVGVDVNSASPSLLKYVSGLNALTARRLVEHRQANGQFKNRDELKSVSGFGDATFVQSAGFLRIHDGDMPLDCTSIHPESYEIALDVLKRVDASIEEFFPPRVTSKTENPAAVATANVVEAKQADVESTSSDQSSADVASEAVAKVETPAPETPAPESPAPETPAPETAAPETAASESTPAKSNEAESAAPPVETTAAPVAANGDLDAKPAEPKKSESVEAQPPQPRVSPESVEKRKQMLKRVGEIDIDQLAQDHSAGKLLVKDILMALKRPKWDPRDKVSKPIFRRGIIKPDDLKPEMQLDGQIVNVVDFGVFVDIGLGESSLVHVSQLSHHFIRDPHRFYAVGDVLKVWVSEVDSDRRRVKLTAVRPGSKKPPSRRQRISRPSASGDSSGKPGDKPARKPGKYGNQYGGGRSKGKPGGRQGYSKGSHTRKPFVRKSKPKEIKPITEGMLKGDEPMRSFSDLAQFVSKKPRNEAQPTEGTQSKDKPSKDDDKS